MAATSGLRHRKTPDGRYTAVPTPKPPKPKPKPANAPELDEGRTPGANTTRQERFLELAKKLTPLQRKNLALLAMPRIVKPYIPHVPHPTQQIFLSLGRYREVLFGGAAGGGKSDALLMAALQYVDVPGYAALILRRTWPDLVLPGAIMDRANAWLSDTPAKKRDGGRLWEFPSGARLQFGYLANANDKYRYQSAEFQYIGWDELTQFPEEETYEYLFSRNRRPKLICLNCNGQLRRSLKTGGLNNLNTGKGYPGYAHADRTFCKKIYPDPTIIHQYRPASDGTTLFDVPLRVRSASNPGGRGMAWVKTRLVSEATRRKSTLFVPSKLTDNPSLDQDSYRESLSYLGAVDRARLEEGDWDMSEPGDMFDRGDFIFVDQIPHNVVQRTRYWDMAATEESSSDFTVGALLGLLDDGRVLIEDMVRVKSRPSDVERTIAATAKMDGIDVSQRMEQEPGSSGVTVIDHYRNVLAGYDFDGVRSTGSKAARAKALSSYVGAKKVLCKLAGWNREMMDEMESFPNEGAHDDIVDGCSGAFNDLMLGNRARLIV